MAEYVLSCCSTVDIPRRMLEERHIIYTLFHLMVGNQEYPDDFGESISQAELYARMRAGEPVKTSQVSIGEYEDLFRPALEAGKDVLHFTLSSGISGSYNSALLAADYLREEFPDRKLYIVDSLSAASGFGLLMMEAADLRDAGKSIDEVRDWAEANKGRMRHWFFTSDLSFLVQGGRISRTAGFFGSMLQICPLLEVDAKGALAPREKIRTKKKAIRRIVDKMEELAEGGTAYSGRCYLNHSECPEDAMAVAELVKERFPNLKEEPQIFPIGTTIGCHTGPGLVALFFWGKPRE